MDPRLIGHPPFWAIVYKSNGISAGISAAMVSYSINLFNELGGNQGLNWAKTDPILIAII